MSKRSWRGRSWWWSGCWGRRLLALRHRTGGGTCRRRGIALAILPGDDQPDPELARFSTLAGDAAHRLWQYAVHGGVENAAGMLQLCRSPDRVRGREWREPVPLMRARGSTGRAGTGRRWRILRRDWIDGAPVAAILFYRALEQAANTAVIDALIAALARLASMRCRSRRPASRRRWAGDRADLLDRSGPDVILNATSFAVSQPGRAIIHAVRQCGLPSLSGGVLRRVRRHGAPGPPGFPPATSPWMWRCPVDGRLITRARQLQGGGPAA